MKKNRSKLILALLLSFGAAEPSARAAASAVPQQMITGKAYYNITGTAVASLTNNAKFPDRPDAIFFLPYFEWNATGDIFTPPGSFSDNYGGQIAGYFYPPSTGDYLFWIAADDNASLYLSPTANPADKKLIARETVWSNAREYTFSGGNSDLTAKDSSQFAASEWAVKDGAGMARITLQANQPYYIEALFKEGTGGDFLSVAVQDPAGAIDATSPIPGQFLATDRAAGPVAVETPPSNQTAAERGSATFRVLANGTPPYSYQWQRNGTAIPDATNLAYTVSSAAIADHNAKYSVVITGAQGTATSADAILTVTPDTIQPALLGAKGSPSLNEVVLTFSEPVDETSGTALANYQIASAAGPLNVTAAARSAGGTQISLSTALQTLGTKYTLLASGVKDTAAAPNTIATGSKAVFFPMGKLAESNGLVVVEAENYDRNLDGLWVRDTTRGTPSGGASVVNPNGAGGSESATKVEYDVEFSQAGTYVVWLRASGDNGDDDSVWIHLDGVRPVEREAGNGASLTGFQPQADFVWRSDSQDGPDPFTIDIGSAGLHTIALARREDGSFVDKILLTLDTALTPSGLGPVETRSGVPGMPAVTLTSPAAGQTFTAGGNIALAATASGQSGLEITGVEFRANSIAIGRDTTAPFSLTWSNVPAGVYGIDAVATDEIGQIVATESRVITVGSSSKDHARIAWISFHPADDAPTAAAATAGFSRAPDAPYTDLLEAQGHEVTRFRTSGTPDTNLLNAFDLVIISRSVPSGDYQDAAETLRWNGITTPVMILGGYIVRQSRLGFSTGTTIPDTVDTVRLMVNDPAHAIFKGIALDANNTMVNPFSTNVTFNGSVQRGISVNTDPLADSGTLLASTDFDGVPGVVVAEFKTGAALANTAADVLGGDRLIFLTGSREANGSTSEIAGIYDLEADGRKMFLNAVNYLAGVEPGLTPTIGLTRTANGYALTFTGTLESAAKIDGPWTADSAAVSPLPLTPNQPVKFFRSKR